LPERESHIGEASGRRFSNGYEARQEAVRRPEFIAKQAGRPSGIVGSLLVRVMALETSKENLLTLGRLDIQSTDHVLEIGFGHGRTIARAAEAAHDGLVAGIDWSERMLKVASRYNAQMIAKGRVALACSASSEICTQTGDSTKHIPYTRFISGTTRFATCAKSCAF
jgi:SAM-dependent methyltransferase